MNLTPEEITNTSYEKQKWCWTEESMVHHDMELSGTLWTPKEQKKEPFPLLIIAPGFYADESLEIVNFIADRVVRDMGVAVFTMNYDNSEVWGYVLGHKQALDYTVEHLKRAAKNIDKEKIGILGVSYGGAIALLAKEKRKGIISLGAPVNPFTILERPYFKKFSSLAPDGGKLIGVRKVHVPPVFEDPVWYWQLNPKLVKDNRLLDEYSTIQSPVVLIHANEGEKGLIPADESRKIFDVVPRGSLFILENTKEIMNPGQMHNFQGSLREPMLVLVEAAVKNLIMNENLAWLQKR